MLQFPLHLIIKKEEEILGEFLLVSLRLRNRVAEVPFSVIGVEALITGSTFVSFYIEKSEFPRLTCLCSFPTTSRTVHFLPSYNKQS
jgi:hypothetical protein